jgi:hypothetical protein
LLDNISTPIEKIQEEKPKVVEIEQSDLINLLTETSPIQTPQQNFQIQHKTSLSPTHLKDFNCALDTPDDLSGNGNSGSKSYNSNSSANTSLPLNRFSLTGRDTSFAITSHATESGSFAILGSGKKTPRNKRLSSLFLVNNSQKSTERPHPLISMQKSEQRLDSPFSETAKSLFVSKIEPPLHTFENYFCHASLPSSGKLIPQAEFSLGKIHFIYT